MYGLSNGENIFYLRWPLRVKGQGQTPQKLRNTFIPVYNRYTHSKPTQKQWVVPCWLHWLLQCALCCYQSAIGSSRDWYQSHSMRLLHSPNFVLLTFLIFFFLLNLGLFNCILLNFILLIFCSLGSAHVLLDFIFCSVKICSFNSVPFNSVLLNSVLLTFFQSSTSLVLSYKWISKYYDRSQPSLLESDHTWSNIGQLMMIEKYNASLKQNSQHCYK